MVTAASAAVAEHNVAAVVRGQLELPVERVIVTWVFHRDDLVDLLAAAIGRAPDHHVALVCDPTELLTRLARRGGATDPARAIERLGQVRATRAIQLDTTGVAADTVADRVSAILRP